VYFNDLLSFETVKEVNTPKLTTNSQHTSLYLVPFAELSREIHSFNLVKFGFGTLTADKIYVNNLERGFVEHLADPGK
jgi:hypothetical protein